MTSNAPIVRSFPWLLAVVLAGLSWAAGFNGLYGQDAHEYLRQSRAIFDVWQSLPAPPASPGDTEFAKAYPLAGALMRLATGNALLAIQLVSWLSAALALYFFVRLLHLLSPGARVDSRWAFAGLGLAASPVFFRAGMTVMSDGLGLALLLVALFYGLRSLEEKRFWDPSLAVLACMGALGTRYALAALLFIPALYIGYEWVCGRRWRALAPAAVVFVAGVVLFVMYSTASPWQHSLLQDWSVSHLPARSFQNVSGAIQYVLPNVLYLLFPLAHPGFCLALPGLFFLFKKTDLALPSKRLLAVSIGGYLLFLGGLPHQNLRYLLPAYALLLLLMFPAWDRLYCYGFLFFPRLTRWVLGTALALQLFFCGWYWRPVWLRNQLEQTIAREIQALAPPDRVIYTFDLDVALRSYLPGRRFQNLWERRIEAYPAGSYLLFNEKLRAQWEGMNPVLNRDAIQQQFRLEKKGTFEDGWELWEMLAPEENAVPSKL
jgi:hypothetical protein